MLVIKIFSERKKVLKRERSVRKFMLRGLIFYKEWSSIYRQENPTVAGGGLAGSRNIRGPAVDPDPFFVFLWKILYLTLGGSEGESFWEEGDDFGVDVLHFHTCLIDILGFLEKLEWWFEQDIDDDEEDDEEGEGGSEV
nr:hypothetical protein [Tanacetum cinerariifolium]